MFDRKEKDNHSYYPSFLYMDVITPDYIGAITSIPMDERTEAAYLHEYIHYLQDITTVSGLAKIETIVDQIKWAVNLNGKLKIPLKPELTFSYNMKPNFYSKKLSGGQMYYKKNGVPLYPTIAKITGLELKEVSCPMPFGVKKKLPALALLKFRDINGFDYKFEVGEGAISESMAYLIENQLYPNVLPSKDGIPYRVVDKIIDYCCGNLQLDKLAIIALCDVCLMHPFPGVALFHMVEILKKKSGTVTPALIYLIGLGGELLKYCGYKTFWLCDFEQIHQQAVKQFSDYFVHPYWSGISIATQSSLTGGFQLRRDNIPFFLDIATQGPIWKNNALKKALAKCGCMGVKTSNDLLYSWPPVAVKHVTIDPDWFVCLRQLYNVLFTNVAIKEGGGKKGIEYKCELRKWCSNSFTKKKQTDITVTDRFCTQCPWLNNTPTLIAQCSFGRLWSAYKLRAPKL